VLPALVKSFKEKPIKALANPPKIDPYPFSGSSTGKLTQDFLWHAVGSFFQPGDLVIGETGTSAFGLVASKLPKGAAMFNQTIFGSIGYATGAAVGAFLGLQETGSYQRGILVTGEGSLHLTVQAFADMLRWELKPIMQVDPFSEVVGDGVLTKWWKQFCLEQLGIHD
jgi:pyruvate decarboxylase